MVRVADLYSLQEIDSGIDATERLLAEAHDRQLEDPAVLEAREQLKVLADEVQHALAGKRDAGEVALDGRPHVAAVELKLYDGSVTNPKELASLQKEFESLTQQQAVRDQTALDAADLVEQSRAAQATAARGLAAGEAEWQASQAQIATEIQQLESNLTALRERRVAATRPVDAATMALYERLRRMRAGRAVARVQRGACLGCRISLPSQVYQKARSGLAVVQCSSCERILYVG